MQLREGEEILKVYHHHPTPFVFSMIKTIIAALPFFVLTYWFSPYMSMKIFVIIVIGISFVFSLTVIYISLIYWLDKMIVTNQRIIYIDWKYLTKREESEAFLYDIQDISTSEKGFLAALKFFDYGSFQLETASAHTTITFLEAPDPEGIRQYVYSVKNE